MDPLETSESTPVDNLSAYQLRVDAPDEAWTHAVIESFLKEFDIVRYLIAHELGEKTKKPHYQGIIFSKKELKDNCRNKIRYYFKTRIKVNTKQPVSITKAKNVKNLEAYCMKTKNIKLTNYTKEEIEEIPEWDMTHNNYFRKKLSELYDDTTMTNKGFCKKCILLHIEYDKCPPTKNMLYKYLLKSKRISTSQYLGELGMFGEWSNITHTEHGDSDCEAD